MARPLPSGSFPNDIGQVENNGDAMTDLDDGSEAISIGATALVAQVTGLPAPAAKGLIGSVYRLLGGGAGYPAAWLQRAVQGVEDGTAARTLIRNELAKAAASQAVTDPRIVDRTMWSLLGEGFRKQVNREAVARAMVEETAKRVADGDDGETVEPDADWMNVFTRFAEDASSERLQSLLGRVLSGEIRKPGAFSLTTLRFLSELDKPTADAFIEFSKEVIVDFAPQDDGAVSGERFRLLNTLETSGLITGFDGNHAKILDMNSSGTYTLVCGDVAIQFSGRPEAKFQPQVYLLTTVAQEIMTIIPKPDVISAIKRWVPRISKSPLTKIDILKVHTRPDGSTFGRLIETAWTEADT